MRFCAVFVLLLLSSQVNGQSLRNLCDGVPSRDGICEVYQSDRGLTWGRIYERFFDPDAFDKAIGVVVGIGLYDSADYSTLTGRRDDAERMRDLLIHDAEFDIVITLTDRAATRDRIEILMEEVVPKLIGENDRFFFHFSGHGETQDLFGGRKRGHLVTSAARSRQNYTNMISMRDVDEWSLGISKARHSLWLIDACFSGLAAPIAMGSNSKVSPGATAETTRRRLAQRGHHILTAGLADEQSLILDGRSVFTNAFIDAVRRGDVPTGGGPQDGFVSLAEIEAYVASAVDYEVTRANQRAGRTRYKMSPRRAALHADDGQFFFLDNTALEVSERSDAPPLPAVIEQAGGDASPGSWYGTGRIWIVDVSGRADASSIGEAIERAAPGDIVRVRPGLYPESLRIDKPLEIIGDGQRRQIILEGEVGSAIIFSAASGRISGLTIRQLQSADPRAAVYVQSGRLFLEGNDLTSASNTTIVGILGENADPVVRRNTIRDGKGSGVFIFSNGRGLIEDNVIIGNALAGIEIKDGSQPIVRRNTIRDGKSSGVYVHSNGRGLIEDNEIFGNTLSGIEIKDGGQPIVRRNTIRDGKSNGVYVHSNGRGLIENNMISNNELHGLSVATGGAPVFVGNTVSASVQYGVVFLEGAGGALRDNDLRGNKLGASYIHKNAGDLSRSGNKE